MSALFSFVLTLAGCIYGSSSANSGYNILFLQSDQMDGRVLDRSSSFWNIVSLPNLRALASDGMNFVNTYTNSPLCAPSRTSMFTGRFINNISAWSNVKSLTSQVTNPNAADPACAKIIGYGENWCVEQGKKQNVTTTILQTMESAGYNVKLLGKMDIGGGMSTDANHSIDADGFHVTNNGNWSKQLGGCNTTTTQNYCPGDLIHSWTRKANITQAQWLSPYQGDWIKTASKTGGSQTPHDENVANNCVNWINNWAKNMKNNSHSKPFLLYCSMVNPHPPYWSNSTWFKYLNYTALNASFDTLLSNFNGTFDSMHEADKFNSISEGVGDVNIDTKWAYDLYQSYFGSCVELDYWMGLIINTLNKYPDLYENTFILYTSDHGEHHLEHLQLEKMSLYEPSARVPLIVKGPNIPSNVVKNNLTSLVDIFPTFLDAANVSYENKIYPKNLNGYSLSPFFNWDWINSNKNNPYLKRADYAFSEYHGDCTNTGQYMLRQNEYKLILYGNNEPYQNYKPQLFNIKTDPFELKNIANENKEILQNMTNILNSLLIETGGGDYNFIDKKCENENKQNFQRWQKQISGNTNNLWINYTNATYTIFDNNDLQKIQKWVKS